MDQPAATAVVVDTRRSPAARLRPVPLTDVVLNDTFWEPRRAINRERTLLSQYQALEDSGVLPNFRRAAGLEPELPFQGMRFADSDLYKWLEAASWTLATHPTAELEARVTEAIELIAAAQRDDGYIDSYFALERRDERWTDFGDHELYCAGHLFQAAVAHHRATRERSLLDLALRFADHIGATFGPAETGRREMVPGHEEVELALVELYRVTGERAYLDQARFFIDARGRGLVGPTVRSPPFAEVDAAYWQDHRPLRQLTDMTGHAVRAVYYTSGAADVLLEGGADDLKEPLEHLWDTMTTARMYISGGIGSRYHLEAFGSDYELPNERSYAESCAAIGSVMWNWRMLALAGEARYADLIERTLYNGMLAGLSLDGQRYFYENPHADDGHHRRKAWFGCACCPPNIARTLASLPGYLANVSDEGAWLHLYAQCSIDTPLPGGGRARLEVNTAYPWDGEVMIEVQEAGDYTLFLRLPGWCEQGAALAINGEGVAVDEPPGSYLALRRAWQAGDTVTLSLPMEIQRVESHPFVGENAGREAVMRGPLLYCLEEVDNPGIEPRTLALSNRVDGEYIVDDDLLGGVVTLRLPATVEPPDPSWDRRLYRTVPRDKAPPRSTSTTVTAVPYYAWANRAPGWMQVWLRAPTETTPAD